MKLVLDLYNDLELKEYLLGQDGINNIDIINNKHFNEVVIDYDKEVTTFIIYKYIELFCSENGVPLISFDKNSNYDVKKLEYVVEDMCCEYCYKDLVENLFLNDNIKSVKSNFDYKNLHNVKFIIEYNKDYNKEELIGLIKNYV